MGRKRLIEMSYTSQPEGGGLDSTTTDFTNTGFKFSHQGGDGEEEDEHKDLVGDARQDYPPERDIWSINNVCPNGRHSAKFNYNHHHWKQHGQDLNDTGGSTADTTDEEFAQNCVMSSASSSISWAEDAVEAELTQKIFGLWEDIQRVATGEIDERPRDMTVHVFDECLKWKRAFPVQNLERFSRYSDDMDGLTPTPTDDRLNMSLQSLLNYKSSSPNPMDSPNNNPESCMTPNPEKNSHYVALWLSDCQNQVLDSESLTQDLKSLSISQNATRCSSPENGVTSTSSASTTPTPTTNMNNFRQGMEPDPNNFFASLALNNVTENNFERFSPDYSKNSDKLKSATTTTTTTSTPTRRSLRVQRPISSNVKGHLITPLPTKFVSSSRSFRETTKSGQHRPYFDDHDEGDEDDDHVNESNSDISSYHFGPIPNRLTIPKGKTAPVYPVCLPPVTPAHCRSSCGPRTNPPRRQSRAGYNNNCGHDINGGYGQFSYNSGGGGGGGGGGNKRKESTTSQSRSSVDNNGFSTNGSGLLPSSNWSRHSSITESFSFKVTTEGGETSTSTTTTRQETGHYFETPNGFDPQTQRVLSRPHFLPLRSQEDIQPAKSKPVRPFLYWLLDKVSPS